MTRVSPVGRGGRHPASCHCRLRACCLLHAGGWRRLRAEPCTHSGLGAYSARSRTATCCAVQQRVAERRLRHLACRRARARLWLSPSFPPPGLPPPPRPWLTGCAFVPPDKQIPVEVPVARWAVASLLNRAKKKESIIFLAGGYASPKEVASGRPPRPPKTDAGAVSLRSTGGAGVAAGPADACPLASPAVYAVNTGRSRFRALPQLPEPRYGGAAAVAGARLHVLGGWATPDRGGRQATPAATHWSIGLNAGVWARRGRRVARMPGRAVRAVAGCPCAKLAQAQAAPAQPARSLPEGRRVVHAPSARSPLPSSPPASHTPAAAARPAVADPQTAAAPRSGTKNWLCPPSWWGGA